MKRILFVTVILCTLLTIVLAADKKIRDADTATADDSESLYAPVSAYIGATWVDRKVNLAAIDTTNMIPARRAEWREFIMTADSVDQDLTTGASPEFANINITDSTSTDKLHITDIGSYSSDREITDLYHLTDKKYVDEAVTALGARYI